MSPKEPAMTMTSERDLMPCPFCLGTSVRLYLPTCTRLTPYDPSHRAFPTVRCACGAEKCGEDWDQSGRTATAAWNRRAQHSTAEPLTDEQRQDLLAAALYVTAHDDDSAVLQQADAERIAELLVNLSGFDIARIGISDAKEKR